MRTEAACSSRQYLEAMSPGCTTEISHLRTQSGVQATSASPSLQWFSARRPSQFTRILRCSLTNRRESQLTDKTKFQEDISLHCRHSTVAYDVVKIVGSLAETGLQLNQSECEIVAEDCKIASNYKEFDKIKEMKTPWGAYVQGTLEQDRRS